jgi:PIN domain nuclease of toxin-antitoxin system
LLLDTHAAIWWWLDSPLLGSQARAAIVAASQAVHVSAVVGIEIAIKFRIGKLDQFGNPMMRFPVLMAESCFDSLPVTLNHALRAGLLPGAHRDPFDRLIAAQALEENLTVVTCDPAFAAFGCKVLW